MSEEILHTRLEDFKNRSHSLRLSASRISAMTGFHPFANLPELLMNLVYQGGQELLHHDTILLGIQIRSEEDVLLELAKKASVETSQALKSALEVKKGKRVLDTIQVAEQVKQQVVKEAKNSKKLSAIELKTLQEGVRSSVDTGYGTHHEDAALDLYERQCGWNVRERNASIMAWPFAKSEDLNGQESFDSPTVVPMSNARAAHRIVARDNNASKESSKDDSEIDKGTVDMDNNETMVQLPEESQSGSDNGEEMANVEAPETMEESSSDTENTPPTSQVSSVQEDQIDPDKAVVDENVLEKKESSSDNTTGEPASNGTEKLFSSSRRNRPFFTIYGSVDGIRDELCPPPPTTDTVNTSMFDEEWHLRQVIVECKHRMKRTFASPPLYDQIQTTTYCLMYNVDDADIVQVMRKPKPIESRKAQKTEASTSTTVDRKTNDVTGRTLRDYFTVKAAGAGNETSLSAPNVDSSNDKDISVVETENNDLEKGQSNNEAGSESAHVQKNEPAAYVEEIDCANQTDTKQKGKIAELKPATSIEIDVKRVSLDDPLLNHRQNWNAFVLPRLRSFVEAVYRIRADDSKRYRLLASMSDPTGNQQEAWNFLHEELPWLRDCDTAFHRDY